MTKAPLPHPLAPLVALLDLIGPREAPALLAQLRADLTTAGDMIANAAPPRDWPTLRRASHNLTALAGTAGATGLQHLAEALNQTANDQNKAGLQDLVPAISAGLATLLARIATLAAERGKR